MPKCKCPPPGAPDWVLTYGDMMSLLLCFFILLVALSELKKPEAYKRAVADIQTTFGFPVTSGKLSFTERIHEIQLKSTALSQSEDPGIEGREAAVTRVREGWLFTEGGRITFEPGSADLTEEARRNLARIAELVRGYNNKIELRGHADAMEADGGSGYADLWALSFARAKAVMEHLTSQQLGIRPDRIRLIANADREPLVKRRYSSSEKEPNRRVEVLVTDSLVEEFTRPETEGREGGGIAPEPTPRQRIE